MARKHLNHDEDNLGGLCGFLASEAGAPIRLDGLLWLAAALNPVMPGADWHRDRTGSALVELLDVIAKQDAEKVSASAEAREALVQLAAHLVARQVPAALALQERISRLH